MKGNVCDNEDNNSSAEQPDDSQEDDANEAPIAGNPQSSKNTHGTPEPVNAQSTSSLKGRRLWSFRFRDLIIVAFAVATVALYYSNASLSSKSAQRPNDKIISFIRNLRTNYPNQVPETWSTIAGQLYQFTDIGNVSPLVIVLAYSKAHRTTMILASEISRAALELVDDPDKCGDTDTARLSGGEIEGGYLLNTFLPQVEKCRKMIMTNLEKLNATAAKDLHSMLDPDYPNIPNVVYIFTVQIPSAERNVYGKVRQVLTSKWSTMLGDDRVNALISRLENNVEVFPEPDVE